MLKRLLEKIIQAAITAGERKLDKITNPLLRRLILLIVGAAEDILLALVDDNKDNEAQMMGIAKKQLGNIITIGAEVGREKVNTFKDVKLAAGIITYLNGLEEVLKALVDDNPANEAQVKEIWNRRKLDLLGDTVDIVTDKLADKIRERIKDPILANIIIELLQSLDLLVKDNPPQPATTTAAS